MTAPGVEPLPAGPGRGIVRRAVIDPIAALLRQGITPRLLAWSLAVGVVIGIFPIVGTTTLLCVALALGLRLNVVAMQVANHLVYPAQLLLLVPFVRLGEHLTGAERLPLSLDQVKAVFAHGLAHGIQALSTSLVHAITGWVVTAPIACVVLYFALRPILERSAGLYAATRAR